MISYEKAFDLKQNGYPQKDYEKAYTIRDGHTKIVMNNPTSNPESLVVIPTLSELIEACAPFNRFSLEYRAIEAFGKNSWTAQMFTPLESLVTNEGSTPEEAVANLWLALNTK